MKRLKSSDDLNSYGGEKGVFKDWGRKDDDPSLHRSSSHRSFYYKSESGKKGPSSSSSRYERVEDDRESSRSVRRRSDYDESYDRRKSYDRHRDGSERGILSSSPRGGYIADRIHRSESFSGPRRDFPKGVRSERDRSRREGSVSSWRRFGGGKDVDEGTRSGGDSARGNKAPSEEMDKVRSPPALRDTKSPPWSKDSESEQSKSFEVKKSESLPAESGNNSEMEEGELEPDPAPTPVAETAAVGQPSGPLDANWEHDQENPVDKDKLLEDEAKSVAKEDIKSDQACVLAENAKVEEPETVRNVMKLVNKPSICQDTPTLQTGKNGVAIEFSSDNEGKKDAERNQDSCDCQDEANDALARDSKPLEEKPKQTNDTCVEVLGGHGSSGVVHDYLETKELTHNFKDKGKSVAISSSNGADSSGDGLRVENESRGFFTGRENDMEGPSTRGFELFFSDPIKKSEKIDQTGVSKPKDENLSFEPLELSLSLPNVLLPIGCKNPVQTPDSPSHEMSVQSLASSLRTNSDGFTMSRSFSGSQHFTHNPSCSLTQNSVDFEQSVGSRPLFQGVAWQVQPSDEQKNRELSMHQRSLSNGTGILHQSQTSHGLSNGQAVPLQGLRVLEGTSKLPLGLERQLSSNNKQPLGSHSKNLNEIRSSSQSVGSHETGSEYLKDRRRGMRENIGTLGKSSSNSEKEKLLTGAAEVVEPLIAMLVSDPLHVVARKLNEMTGQSLSCLKESVRDVILNPNKRRQLSAYQRALENRSDITLEMLLKAHSAHIEILVALKTGIQEFLLRNDDISSSDLAEVFVNLRCRNLTCRSYLPVDECDCKICVQKNGFCSACMCLVCSKFDMASNTCSWVGCDVCLHWCHTDCGLRESYIRNGHSATGAQGQTEMQFHCVACDHPSEMFGFVREVFQNFAKGWTAETLSNELEYVRRIFSASGDIRGKRLHEISLQMLSRLANKSDLQQVRSYIMGFLSDSESFKSGNMQISQGKEVAKQNQGESINGIATSSQEAALWMKSVYPEKQPSLKAVSSDIQMNAPSIPREPVFDDLDSIVRIKLAEAKMFQTRADDARREAEGLKCIAIAKNKKIEEEFDSRIAKLHLSESEEIRRQKVEQLQALENAHQEYFNMKVRMERDIKDLLLKMEATKRNFG